MPLTQTAARDSLRESTEERWLNLVEISHPTIPASGLHYPDPSSTETIDTRENTLRLVYNTEPIVADHGAGARTYHPAMLEVVWYTQAEDQIPSASLKISFATALVKELRELTTPPDLEITIKRVLASSPNDIQGRIYKGKVRSIEYDALTIEVDLLPPDMLDAAQPRWLFTPTHFPALFGVSGT